MNTQMPINLSGLLLSIIVQDMIIHNKDLTNNNNYFNRSPVPRHDSLRVDQRRRNRGGGRGGDSVQKS